MTTAKKVGGAGLHSNLWTRQAQNTIGPLWKLNSTLCWMTLRMRVCVWPVKEHIDMGGGGSYSICDLWLQYPQLNSVLSGCLRQKDFCFLLHMAERRWTPSDFCFKTSSLEADVELQKHNLHVARRPTTKKVRRGSAVKWSSQFSFHGQLYQRRKFKKSPAAVIWRLIPAVRINLCRCL